MKLSPGRIVGIVAVVAVLAVGVFFGTRPSKSDQAIAQTNALKSAAMNGDVKGAESAEAALIKLSHSVVLPVTSAEINLYVRKTHGVVARKLYSRLASSKSGLGQKDADPLINEIKTQQRLSENPTLYSPKALDEAAARSMYAQSVSYAPNVLPRAERHTAAQDAEMKRIQTAHLASSRLRRMKKPFTHVVASAGRRAPTTKSARPAPR